MACTNNGDFTEISTYWHGIRIGLLKLMCFNDLHLLYKFTGVHSLQSYTDTHVYMNKWMEYHMM